MKLREFTLALTKGLSVSRTVLFVNRMTCLFAVSKNMGIKGRLKYFFWTKIIVAEKNNY